MSKAGKRAKAQMMILEEVKRQLVLQAERWGRSGHYTPLKLEEMEIEACRRIKGDLLSERANLEYEMHMLASNKKEIEIKLSRLESYLKRADRVGKKHGKNVDKMIEKLVGDRAKTFEALGRVGAKAEPAISVLISDN
jgi:hypothetical protein